MELIFCLLFFKVVHFAYAIILFKRCYLSTYVLQTILHLSVVQEAKNTSMKLHLVCTILLLSVVLIVEISLPFLCFISYVCAAKISAQFCILMAANVGIPFCSPKIDVSGAWSVHITNFRPYITL